MEVHMTNFELLKEISNNNNGFIQTSVALKNGISKTVLSRFVKKYNYDRVAHGIYLAPDEWYDNMYLLQLRCPEAIFSHESALYFLNMTDQDGIAPVITVRSGSNAHYLGENVGTIYYVKDDLFELGLTKIKTPFGNVVRVYNPERTVCDIVRNKAKIEIQSFRDGMREYVMRKDKNLNLLMEYSTKFKIEKKVRMYMEVLLP